MTDRGRRSNNEDVIDSCDELGLYVVADGAGGQRAGEVASRTIVQAIRSSIEAQSAPGSRRLFGTAGAVDVGRAIREGNSEVHRIATSAQQYEGMCSTLVMIYASGDSLTIAHVGDSRCYRFRNGALEQLTVDHTLFNEAQSLLAHLGREQLARLTSNTLARAVGMDAEVLVDFRVEPVCAGDLYLLCSDGLCGKVQDEALVERLAAGTDLRTTCLELVELAKRSGSSDNISVLLLRLE